MKRMCAIVVNELPKGTMGYISSMLKSWEDAGVQTYVIENQVAMGKMLGRPTGSGIAEAVEYAKSQEVEELILMTDEMMGPVFPLNELLSRMDRCGGKIWQLVRGAEMYGIPKAYWNIHDYWKNHSLD